MSLTYHCKNMLFFPKSSWHLRRSEQIKTALRQLLMQIKVIIEIDNLYVYNWIKYETNLVESKKNPLSRYLYLLKTPTQSSPLKIIRNFGLFLVFSASNALSYNLRFSNNWRVWLEVKTQNTKSYRPFVDKASTSHRK